MHNTISTEAGALISIMPRWKLHVRTYVCMYMGYNKKQLKGRRTTTEYYVYTIHVCHFSQQTGTQRNTQVYKIISIEEYTWFICVWSPTTCTCTCICTCSLCTCMYMYMCMYIMYYINSWPAFPNSLCDVIHWATQLLTADPTAMATQGRTLKSHAYKETAKRCAKCCGERDTGREERERERERERGRKWRKS